MSSVPLPVGRMRAGQHCCLGFDTDDEQRDVVSAFVREGLASRDKVVYISADEPAEAVRRLQYAGLDTRRGLRSGQLEVFGADEAYLAVVPFDPDAMVERLRELLTAALSAGFDRCRVTGEMHALKGRPGWERLVEYERKVEAVRAGGPLMGLCQYDRRVFTEAELAALREVHTATVTADPVYQDELLCVTRRYEPRGLRMSGEIDISHHRLWDDVLTAEVDPSAGDVYVDVSDVRFLDVAGARMFGVAARCLAQRGSRLHLQGAGTGPRKVLHLTRWDRLPGLVLDAADRIC